MKRFLRYYKWEFDNELFAGLYFLEMICIYSTEVLLNGGRSIDILILYEMFGVALVMAIIQKIIFSKGNVRQKSLIIRTIIWFTSIILLILIASILFGWFIYLQAWALVVFEAFMTFMLLGMWIGIHVANKKDTEELNQLLLNYQKKR